MPKLLERKYLVLKPAASDAGRMLFKNPVIASTLRSQSVRVRTFASRLTRFILARSTFVRSQNTGKNAASLDDTVCPIVLPSRSLGARIGESSNKPTPIVAL